MKSVKDIYKVGKGPSSSHTMGPFKAIRHYMEHHMEADKLHVTLYGSLAATGKGHLTDTAIIEAFDRGDVTIEWEPQTVLQVHPNGMKVAAVNFDGDLYDKWTYYSVGGGDIICMDHPIDAGDEAEVYEMNTMKEILDWCNSNGKTFWEFVAENEKNTKGFWEHLEYVWEVMQKAVERGIDEEGALPGPLNLRRKAGSYYIKADGYGDVLRTRGLIFAYALAVSEENACGGTIVTAPTCGSCGILPGALYHLKKVYGFSDQRIIRALATAGIIGNIVKYNASISGAEVGCQGEVGVACAMAAGAITQLMGGSPSQIEYAAEMGLEHHLGLTCDPVCGMVQIPCIERNAMSCKRALDCAQFALLTDGNHYIKLDDAIQTMVETGKDLHYKYRETSEGGLAKIK